MNSIKDYYNYNFLKSDEEYIITRKVKEGDKEAKEKLIKAYLKMVVSIAKKFTNNSCVSFEDLIQEGCLGLIFAAENFEPSYNVRFSSYAKIWIKEIIKRRFCKDVYIVSTPFRVVKKSFYFNKEKNMPKEVKKGENSAIIDILKKPFYVDNKNNFDNSNFDIEAENSYYYPHLRFEIEDTFRILKDSLDCLNEKERIIIENRFFNVKKPTYIDIGKLLLISPETVRNIEKRALKKIKLRLNKKGFKI
ncbi:MAG TPA: sigma-70 family RNA polymerase sigma factor [Spirochaetota bacterium]|nr:sigma-70 family RNA polymerase sigma factor [Spirochaetota bacterium]HOM39163.1 sigma-70 family RNA polymerase sigma factor [Spirochaetota bacterium]HPQ48340.1 sigma-70 family RNA polymerase sigma factor [Spirochaetota bacterium]